MRDENAPPTRKSTVAAVVCQSSDAAFHCLMSSGVVQARQISSIGAAIVVSTVIFMFVCSFLCEVVCSGNDPSSATQSAKVGQLICCSVCARDATIANHGVVTGTFKGIRLARSHNQFC